MPEKIYFNCKECFFGRVVETDVIWCTRLLLDINLAEGENANNCDHFILIDFVEDNSEAIEKFIIGLSDKNTEL